MTLLRPRSEREALSALGAHPEAIPLAGGTDFMVAWNAGLLNGKTVLDLTAIDAWSRITAGADSLSIGALATHAALKRDSAVRRRFPLLAQSCATVGGEQIQNRGTLGGNIANASPAGDSFPALAVYEPMIRTLSPRGVRAIAFADIFAGVKRTTLQPAELIVAIDVPFLKTKPSRQLFRKVGTRAAQAISKTVAAGLLWLNSDGTVASLRFAFGSVAPTVRRLRAVEAFAAGKSLSSEVVGEACRLLDQDISPIDDIRSTRDYRLEVSRNLLRDFLTRGDTR